MTKPTSTPLAVLLLTAYATYSAFADGNPPLAEAPFSADRAKELQQQWADYLGRDVVETNAAGMKMTLIPPGLFTMGTPEAEIDAVIKGIRSDPKCGIKQFVIDHIIDRGTKSVKISRPFYMGTCEVTVGQFRNFVEATGYKTYQEIWDTAEGVDSVAWRYQCVPNGVLFIKGQWVKRNGGDWNNVGYERPDDAPLFNVNTYDMNAFCHWLSKTEGRRYRLPTEAEWEHACRAGTTTWWHFGNDPAEIEQYAWIISNTSSSNRADIPRPVGRKKPNPFGLHDMHGNLYERCVDSSSLSSFHDFQSQSPLVDPAGLIWGGGPRLRGGSHDGYSWLCRSAARIGGGGRSNVHHHIGFRLVSTVDLPGGGPELKPLPLSKAGPGAKGPGKVAKAISKDSDAEDPAKLRASADQLDKHPENPVFVLGACPAGQEACFGRFSVDTINGDGGSGVYHLWYPEADADGSIRLLFAYGSHGGVNWWRRGEKSSTLWRGIRDEWDDSYVGMPSLHLVSVPATELTINGKVKRDRQETKVWLMWYIGEDKDGDSGLGLATLPERPELPQEPEATKEYWSGHWTWTDHWTRKWQKHGMNPLLLGPIQDPCVLRVGRGFRLWCVRPVDGKNRICYAESADAVHWTEFAAKPVVPLGTQGEFDSDGHANPRVIAVGDQFFMWFLGNDGRQWRVGFATSPDGVHWTKSKANPILEGGDTEAWDAGSIWGLDVVHEGDRFHIWYSATDHHSRDPQTIRIGYANSRPK